MNLSNFAINKPLHLRQRGRDQGAGKLQRPYLVPRGRRGEAFHRAAARLNVAQSTLSHAVKQLETRMGSRLLTRTTRSISTTEAGERLRQSMAPRFEEIDGYRDKPDPTGPALPG